MRNSPIGIFDSGIGGLTIVNAIKSILPNENFIYFGDTKHLPYGEKSKESIQNFSKQIIDFLIKQKCKIIIIACNSASSVTYEKPSLLKNTKIEILNVIDPILLEIKKININCSIGVIGTKATIQSGIYDKKIKALCVNAKVHTLATPLLAPMIEEGFINEKISDTIIQKYLSNPKLKNIDHLILACTHYPLIYKEIKKYYEGNVTVVDSAYIIARYVQKKLAISNLLKNTAYKENRFYVSNYTKSFKKSAKFFFQEDINLEEVCLNV